MADHDRPETEDTDEPVCPYCGASFTADEPCYFRAEDTEFDCDHCDETFVLTANHSVTFTTRRKECAGGKHVWLEPECRDISQETCDRWDKGDIKSLKGLKAHRYWARACENCDEEQYSETMPIGGPCPWPQKKVRDET